jgi:hypothetical protein
MRIRELPLEDDSFPPRPRSCRNRTPTPTAGLRLDVSFEWLAHVPSGVRACACSPAASRAIQPRCHGSGTRRLSLFPAPSVAIARHGSFTPTRSARTPAVVELVAMPAGEADPAGHTRAGVRPLRAHRASLLALARKRGAPDARFLERPAGPDGSSRGSSGFLDELASPPGKETAFTAATGARAASRTAPRREMRSAAPEVPSIDVLPHSKTGSRPPSIRGWAAVHMLSPTCGILLPAPLRSVRFPPPLTRQWGAWTRLPPL